MNRPAGPLLVALALSGVVCGVPPADAAPNLVPRRIALSIPGAVLFQAPAEWQVSAKRFTEGGYPTVEFKPPAGEAFSVLITIMWRPEGDSRPFEPEEIRKGVEAGRNLAARSATTRKIAIHELKSEGVSGYYFSAIDRDPKPGEYRYMTSGTGSLEDLMLTFTAFSNDAKEPEAAALLDMLKSARRQKPVVSR